MFVRAEQEYKHATALLALGLTTVEVANGLRLPLSTVKTWSGRPLRRRPGSEDVKNWRPADARAYSYVLGMYLGDGCLSKHRRGSSYDLRVCLDALYQGVIDEVAEAIVRVVPDVSVRRFRRQSRCVVLQASHRVWPSAFPQHGPGKKHLRPILLEPWQLERTQAHPRELIRGLIHSDGCRCSNRFRTKLSSGRVAEYSYVRYFFSNLSSDIKDIFCSHCDLLGIRWSRANARYVSVHDRKSVAILDEFVGPKG